MSTISEDGSWDRLYELRYQVQDRVMVRVRAQVKAQVGAQVRDQVRAQVGAQVRAQVRAQVWDQVRAQEMGCVVMTKSMDHAADVEKKAKDEIKRLRNLLNYDHASDCSALTRDVPCDCPWEAGDAHRATELEEEIARLKADLGALAKAVIADLGGERDDGNCLCAVEVDVPTCSVCLASKVLGKELGK